MKVKTARRFLSRNKWNLMKLKLETGKLTGFAKTCLKILRKDIRDTQNKASIRVHNQIVYR